MGIKYKCELLKITHLFLFLFSFYRLGILGVPGICREKAVTKILHTQTKER
jgi:hypothetical protein